MTLEVLDQKIESLGSRMERLTEAVTSGFEHVHEKMESEFAKVRDDIHAVEGKVSGIWNVLDQHGDRLHKIETTLFGK
jgi:tRNA A-37 threonylcarbamoyl transferase component Bud32